MLGWINSGLKTPILRWITASGVKPLSDENHRTVGKNLAMRGYDPSKRAEAMQGNK